MVLSVLGVFTSKTLSRRKVYITITFLIGLDRDHYRLIMDYCGLCCVVINNVPRETIWFHGPNLGTFYGFGPDLG